MQLLAAIVATGVMAVGVTAAQPGELNQLTGPGACISQLDTEGLCADGRSLNSPDAIAVSPDGRSVYVSAYGGVGNDAGGVAVFTSSPPEGRITQRPGPAGCISNSTDDCGRARALFSPSGVSVSPDGRNVYVTGFNPGSVMAFSRSATGELTQLAGPNGCTNVDGAEECRGGSAFFGAADVEVSRDGRNVYVASFYSDAVDVLSRDVATGAIAQLSGPRACVQLPGDDGELSPGCSAAAGLDGPIDLVVSPDDRNVYAVSALNTLAAFRRDASGALTQLPGQAGCFSSSDTDVCAAAPFLEFPLGVAMSADGRNLYAASYYEETGATVSAFRRDPASGALTPIPGGVQGSDLRYVSDVAAAPDGMNVYAISPERGALFAFARNADGMLVQLPGEAACNSDVETGDSCRHAQVLARASALAVSPDGRKIYVASGQPGGSSELSGPQFGSLSVFARQVTTTMSLTKVRAGSAGIRAGRAFSITSRLTTNAVSVKVTCSARVASRSLRTRVRTEGGLVSCTGVVPPGTTGKRMTGAIGVTAGGLSRTAPFSFVIKR